MSLQTEITQTFKLFPTDKETIQELESICYTYSLIPEKLKMKWEAFALSNKLDLKPSLPYLKILRKSLQKDFDRSLAKGKTTVKFGSAVRGASANTFDFSEYGLDATSEVTPVDDFLSKMFITPKKSTKPTTQSNQTTNQFKASHKIVAQYNNQLPIPEKDTTMDIVENKLEFEYVQKPIKANRLMFEKIKEKAEGLNERIDYIGSLIQEKYNIEVFNNPVKVNQESMYAYGMIIPEVGSDNKIDEKSIVLQTSRELGNCKRVLLDLSEVGSYSLFPGQIVGVKGVNNLGLKFLVEEILMPPTPERGQYRIKENKAIDMIISSGPFTFDSDLLFNPLQELLDKCRQEKPDVLILMGPFLSSSHPLISSGKIEQLPEDIVYEQVITRLENLLNTCTETHVFLIPDCNDITQMYNIFPQPPLPSKTLNIKNDRIHLSSNPCSLLFNGHLIGLANIDILLKLGKQEIVKNPEQSDRFIRLTEHLLNQRTYYPLSPHVIEDTIDTKSMIDIFLPEKPDIIILPSEFKHFIKQVQGSVCINPGYLCKHKVPGTYAKLILYPNLDEQVRVDLFQL